MKTFLTAQWKYLAMANYEIDPRLLKPYCPAGVELDYFNGKCYVSLVGFLFLQTKIKGITVPYHVNFEEVNLRFYVKRFDKGKWKRGVVFVREIVPKFLIATVANLVYNERYMSMPMGHSLEITGDNLQLSYSWGKGFDHSISITASNFVVPINERSLEEFITEHYWGYAKANNNETYEYEVKHPGWGLLPLHTANISCNFRELYGEPFAVLDNNQPASVLLAEGSAISVSEKKKLQL